MLTNKALVLPVGLPSAASAAIAHRLGGEGAAVVLVVPEDEPEAGRLAADLAPARTTVFVLSGEERSDLDALVELLNELFP